MGMGMHTGRPPRGDVVWVFSLPQLRPCARCAVVGAVTGFMVLEAQPYLRVNEVLAAWSFDLPVQKRKTCRSRFLAGWNRLIDGDE